MSNTRSGSSKTKRTQIVVACDTCRKSKTRCSGGRPACRTCQDRKAECHYSADADAHPVVALKRKLSALSDAFKQQKLELELLRSRHDANLTDTLTKEHVPAIQQIHIVPSIETGSDGVQSFLPVENVSTTISPLPYSKSQEEAEIDKNRALQILNSLKYKSDQESLILLARLRLGEDFGTLADPFSHGGQPDTSTTAQPAVVFGSHSASFSSALAPEDTEPLSPRSQVVAFGVSTTDKSQPQKTVHAAENATPPPKPWLSGMFDRQYFMQVTYMHCTPGPSIVPGTPGTQSSFGNMPFASAIGANHFPEHIQKTQQNNFSVPIWKQRVLNSATVHVDPFQEVLAQLMDDVAKGAAIDELCGSHPYIEALDNAATFHRAPLLSQIAARTIASIKTTDTDTTFTQYAMMYWFWALWRWLLYPTMETYAAIPEFAQPTKSQLFVSHPSVFDFVLPPGLREMLCQHETPNIQWFTEAAITIECHWDGSAFAALCRDGMTNEIDFNPICKLHISSLDNWTLGCSVRSFLPNVDSFTNIK